MSIRISSIKKPFLPSCLVYDKEKYSIYSEYLRRTRTHNPPIENRETFYPKLSDFDISSNIIKLYQAASAGESITLPPGTSKISCRGKENLQIMSEQQPNNPLHGITLEQIVNNLLEHYGWDELGKRVNIHCFKNDPSVKSSLKFLRRTPWARIKVEDLYIAVQKKNSTNN